MKRLLFVRDIASCADIRKDWFLSRTSLWVATENSTDIRDGAFVATHLLPAVPRMAMMLVGVDGSAGTLSPVNGRGDEDRSSDVRLIRFSSPHLRGNALVWKPA
jgi:hypothetical protein